METIPLRAVTLVVNGDDFGQSAATNTAILHTHHEGILTSTTLLVNRPATDAALALAASHPTLGVGLHLNLTEGAPLLPPEQIPALVDHRGQFLRFHILLSRLVTGRVPLGEVEREFRAQIEYMLARGQQPTHLDGHLHVHAYPRLSHLVLRLMDEYGIQALRSPALATWLPLYFDARFAPRAFRPTPQPMTAPAAALQAQGEAWEASLRSTWGRATRNAVARERHARSLAHSTPIAPDFLLDCGMLIDNTDPATALVGALESVRGGIVELMTHPGFTRDAARGHAESTLLTTPGLRARLDEHGVRLTHYGELCARPMATSHRALSE